MSLQKAAQVHSSLIKTASKFLSPSIRQYFIRKANNDFESVKKLPDNDIKNYLSEQKDLTGSLERVVGIYNMYRDESSTL